MRTGARWWRVLALAAVLTTVVAACSAQDADDALVWAYETEPSVLNPYTLDGSLYATSQVALATLLPLWIITPDFEYVESPLLDSAEPAGEGADFTVTYRLNDDADWSDGTPITAGDVFFSLEICLDPDADITTREGCNAVDMEATQADLDPDGKEITLHFVDDYAPWQTLFATADGIILPAHVLDGSRGEAFNAVWADGIVDPETGEPIASGPFIFDSWDPGRQLEIVRNDAYVGEPASLDRIVFRFERDFDTQVQRLRGDEIDLMEPQPQLDLVELIQAIDGVEMDVAAGADWEVMFYQATHPLLRNDWMRIAISKGIDRATFIDEFIAPMHPGAEPLNSVIYVQNQDEYEDHFGDIVAYDPDEATTLLEDNGCEAGDDGIYVCDGERASFTVVSTSDNERRELFFDYAQDQLADIGIELEADFGEIGTIIQDFFAGTWDIFVLAGSSEPDPIDNIHLWGCFDDPQAPTAGAVPDDPFDLASVDAVHGGQNYHRYCPDAAVSDTLLATNVTVDPDERARLMNEAGAAIAEAVPVLPLYQVPTIMAWNAERFTGFEVNATQWGQVWNIAEWRRAEEPDDAA